jgi:uridylate kinase
MDSTALALCMENNLPVIVFALAGDKSIERAVAREEIGTFVGALETLLVGERGRS